MFIKTVYNLKHFCVVTSWHNRFSCTWPSKQTKTCQYPIIIVISNPRFLVVPLLFRKTPASFFVLQNRPIDDIFMVSSLAAPSSRRCTCAGRRHRYKYGIARSCEFVENKEHYCCRSCHRLRLHRPMLS